MSHFYRSPGSHSPLPTPDLTNQPYTGFTPATFAPSNPLRLASVADPSRTPDMDPFQIQTPPPTRDSSTRRKDQGQMIPPETPLHAASAQRNMASPNSTFPHGGSMFESPFQFNPLQFSPDAFQFPTPGTVSGDHLGPPSFWDQNVRSDGVEVPSSLLSEDPFGVSPQRPNMASWQPFGERAVFPMTQQPFPEASPMDHARHQGMWPSQSMQSMPPQHVAQPPPQPPVSVNPHMLMSMSTSMDPSACRPHHVPMGAIQETRQPYEQQARESSRQARQQHSRTPITMSSNSSFVARPGLQRSNTDSGFRRLQRSHAQDQRMGMGRPSPDLAAIPRRPSPLKRLSQNALASIPESVPRSRTRTRLVIDEYGRARTETEQNPGSPSHGSTTSQSSTQTGPRRLGSGSQVWLAASSDSEDEDELDEPVIHSQRSSFMFPTDLPLPGSGSARKTKHARLDGHERMDVARMPRSASATSLPSRRASTAGFAHAVSRKLGAGAPGPFPGEDRRRFSQGSFGAASSISGGFPADEHSSEAATPGLSEDGSSSVEGQAQTALKQQLLEGRRRAPARTWGHSAAATQHYSGEMF